LILVRLGKINKLSPAYSKFPKANLYLMLNVFIGPKKVELWQELQGKKQNV